MNRYRGQDPWLVEHRDDIYMTMIETAEIVAERYKISRERQDEYRAAVAGAHRGGLRPPAGSTPRSPRCPSVMKVADKATGAVSDKAVTLKHDEGVRADTTLEGLAALKPVFADGQRVKSRARSSPPATPRNCRTAPAPAC